MKCLEKNPQARYSSAAALAPTCELARWRTCQRETTFPLCVDRDSSATQSRVGLCHAVALAGSVLSFPLILNLLSMWSGEELYANTPEDPLPALYYLSAIPTWISASASIVTLLMWPMLGMRSFWQLAPNRWRKPLERNGARGVCGLLFFLAIGWYPISRSTIIASGRISRRYPKDYGKTTQHKKKPWKPSS